LKDYLPSVAVGATVKSLRLRHFENLPVVLFPITTQQKIVAKLDAIFTEIDTATAAAEANANNAEALFQSYVTEVFESEKYDFKLVKFGTTASFVRGPFGGSLKKSIFVEKGYAVYEQQHAIYNQFSDIRYFIDETKFEEMKRFEIKSGDLIMSCSGTMGKIAIVPENIQQGVINQALLKISPNKNVMGEYIARLLSSKYFQDILTKLSGGAAIKNVPAVSVLKDIEVPVPIIKNQKLIIDIIDILESNKSIIKNSYKSKSKELASLKQSILQKAFSGELVKD
jgi:type I restriction enzyme S subunit